MKRKIMTVGLALSFVAMTVVGCTPRDGGQEKPNTNTREMGSKDTVEVSTEDAGIQYDEYYATIIENTYDLITKGAEQAAVYDGQAGIAEAVESLGKEEALKTIGYAIQDLSGDGVPELAIGEISDNNDSGFAIYALYTYEENGPHLVVDGSYRNRYDWMGNGQILNQGSAGAMYAIFGTFTLAKNGMTMECDDFYFTAEKDETTGEIGFYHNNTGDIDTESSEEMAVTADEFFEIQDNLALKRELITFIPFSQCGNGEENTDADADDETEDEADVKVSTSTVSVQYADEEMLANETAYAECIADESEYAVKILFTTDGRVNNFKFFSIVIDDVDENGKLIYTPGDIYTSEVFASDYPLVATLTFWGDTPSYGISYEDESGTLHTFLLEQSGFDGSLILIEQ